MYFNIYEDEKVYKIQLTDKFYKITSPFYKKDSFFNIFYRLFNLLPKDFYHYVGARYNASFKKGQYIQHVIMFFKDENDAREFCKELNRRFTYCVNRGDFS